MVKNPPANAGDAGSVLVSGRSPGGGNDNPFQYSCPVSLGQRSLVDLWSRGRKESDMTEQVCTG